MNCPRGNHFQMVPFQCCTIVVPRSEPTAQALLAEVAATPTSWLNWPGVGLGTCFQAVPFHRSIRVRYLLRV